MMYKNNLLKQFPFNTHCKLRTYTPRISLCSLRRNIVSVCRISNFCGAIGRLLIDKVAWSSCMRIRDVFNTLYFIINSKITALRSFNRSAVLTYIYIHTHTNSRLLENIVKWQTHTHTHTYAWSRRQQTRASRGAEWSEDNRHTYTHSYLYSCFIACTNTNTPCCVF